MDASARRALHEEVRAALGADLDAVHVELAQLRAEMRTVRALAGTVERLPQEERQAEVARLRAEGYSLSLIADTLKAARTTVARDVVALGLPPATRSLGRDGVTRRYGAAS